MIKKGVEECKRRKAGLAKFPGLEAPELPLIRLRVEHTNFDSITSQAFGQQFIERIANPEEILLWFRRKGGETKNDGSARKVAPIGDILTIEEAAGSAPDNVKVQDIIYKYLAGEQSLAILPEPELNEAVQSFVHKSEPCAIEKFVTDSVTATNQAVTSESHAKEEEEIRVQMQDRTERLRQQRLALAPPDAAPDAAAPAAAPAPAAAAASGDGALVGSQAVGRSQSVPDF